MKVLELKRWWLSACVAVLAACGGSSGEETPAGGAPGGGGNPPPPTVQTVAVTPASATLEPGQTMVFTAVARDAGGNAVAGATFTWSTSNAAVAIVNGAGLATGVALGTVSIRASVAGIDSNVASLAVLAPGANRSSEQLIAAALAAGEIDAETALAYRVFATFGDARLPAQYRGNETDIVGSSVLSELRAKFDTLGAATRSQMQPFLLRPSSVGSWLDPTLSVSAAAVDSARRLSVRTTQTPRPEEACRGVMGHWATFDPARAPVRVWYDTREPGHHGIAATAAGHFETAWSTLIGTLLFPAPLDDEKLVGCDGGDSRLDVYIVKNGPRGETVGEAFPSYDRFASAAYILIRASAAPVVLEHAVAHELGHAIHRGFPKATLHESYGWFNDAFANWAAMQVVPQNQSLKEQASCMFRSPHLVLDDRSAGHCDPVGSPAVNRDYGAHLPLQYLAQTLGPDIVKLILTQQAGASTAYEAIENTLAIAGTDLKTQWPLYAQILWNQGPITARGNSFAQPEVGGLTNKPLLAPDRNAAVPAGLGNNQGYDETRLDARVNNMSVKYYHFTFATGGDVTTRTLMFHNAWYESYKAGQKVSVYALYKPENKPWVEEDLTKYEYVGFCRDLKDQRIEELVLIVASAEWRGANPVVQPSKEPKLMRNNIGCYGWSGNTKRIYSSTSWGSGGYSATEFAPTFDYHPGGTPLQYTDEATGRKRIPLAAPLFRGGSLNFREDYTEGNCRNTANAMTSELSVVLRGTSAGTIVINNFHEALPESLRADQELLIGTTPRAYVADGVTDRMIRGQVQGPETCGTTYETAIGIWLLTPSLPETPRTVLPDGRLYSSYQRNRAGDNFSDVFEWDLSPMRE